MIRVTKHIEIEMAHKLLNYEGKCKYLHGHTYKFDVTIGGYPDDIGMVIDFKLLKEVMKIVFDKYDHSCLLASTDEDIEKEKDIKLNIIRVPYNPTIENILEDISNQIKEEIILKNLPVHLTRIIGFETSNSYAEIIL